MMEDIIYGSQVVINLHIDPIDGVSARDYDFNVVVSAKRDVSIAKKDLVGVDADNYIILLDTTECGLGEVSVRVEAYLPDGRWPKETRKEITVLPTGINIVKA